MTRVIGTHYVRSVEATVVNIPRIKSKSSSKRNLWICFGSLCLCMILGAAVGIPLTISLTTAGTALNTAQPLTTLTSVTMNITPSITTITTSTTTTTTTTTTTSTTTTTTPTTTTTTTSDGIRSLDTGHIRLYTGRIVRPGTLPSKEYLSTATTTAMGPQSCTVGSPTMLLNLYNPGSFSYTYYSYSYTPTSTQATIMVELQQDPSSICIDVVSVVNSLSQQLLTNGGFETGSLAPWQHGTVSGGSVSSGCGYSGSYCYSDAIVGQTDNIHQTFSTIPGNNLTISFYLQNNSAGSVIIARVCIYPY